MHQLDLLGSKTEPILLSSTYEEFKTKLKESGCSQCEELCAERTNIVVDRGNPKAKIAVIGEAPGENEDLEGKAFVGRAGQLLDKIMASIGLDTNKDMIILNVVKCRPPKNRAPKQSEAQNCIPYLKWQLDFIKPSLIILLGATAAKHIMPDQKNLSMKDRVGKIFELDNYPQTKFILLFHPAYLLRDPRKKKDMWEHVKVLRDELQKGGITTYEGSDRRF